MLRTIRRLLDFHRLEFHMRNFSDVLGRNAPVKAWIAAVFRHGIDDDGAVENLRHLMMRNPVLVRARIAKPVRRHKGETVRAQTKFKTDADGTTIITEAKARPVARRRRQRCPAAIAFVVAPAHPRRPPDRVRRPAPAPGIMAEPASIVERCPAPRIIRRPIPAAVRKNPMAPVAVRRPTAIHHFHRRLPAAAITFHFNPVSVRRERVIKIGGGDIDLRSRCLLGDRRSRDSFRNGRGHRCRHNRHRRIRGLQDLITLDHRCHHAARHANVVEVDDLIRAEIEGARGIVDIGEHHLFVHARLRQPHQFGGGGIQGHSLRGRLRPRNQPGRRSRQFLIRDPGSRGGDHGGRIGIGDNRRGCLYLLARTATH